jgi:hypothetical protein
MMILSLTFFVPIGAFNLPEEKSNGETITTNPIQREVASRTTINGEQCVFPFTWRRTTYNDCTFADTANGQPWCATSVNSDGSVIIGQWGACAQAQSNDENLNTLAFDQREVASRTAINGEQCVFPFTYKERTFNDCTFADTANGQPWCATSVNSDGSMFEGADCAQAQSNDENLNTLACECNNVSPDYVSGLANCGSVFEGKTWCYVQADSSCADVKETNGFFWSNVACAHDSVPIATEDPIQPKVAFAIVEDSNQSEVVTRATINGKQCVFPFIYQNRTFEDCTNFLTSNEREWCATAVDDDGIVIDNEWADCALLSDSRDNQVQVATVYQKPSPAGFIELGYFCNPGQDFECVEGLVCSLAGHESRAFWTCQDSVPNATEDPVQPEVAFAIVDSAAATRATINGKQCVFPFTYQDRTFNDCTLFDTSNEKEWCATAVDDNGSVEMGEWADCAPLSDSRDNQLPVSTVFQNLSPSEGFIELGQYCNPGQDFECVEGLVCSSDGYEYGASWTCQPDTIV